MQKRALKADIAADEEIPDNTRNYKNLAK